MVMTPEASSLIFRKKMACAAGRDNAAEREAAALQKRATNNTEEKYLSGKAREEFRKNKPV